MTPMSRLGGNDSVTAARSAISIADGCSRYSRLNGVLNCPTVKPHAELGVHRMKASTSLTSGSPGDAPPVPKSALKRYEKWVAKPPSR